MHSLTLISALAGVSLVLANPAPSLVVATLITPAPLFRIPKPVERRETDSPSEDCQSAQDDLYDSVPGVAFSDPLGTWLESQAEKVQTASLWDIDAMCDVPFPKTDDVPGPISSAYVSFTSKYASWASEARPTIMSVAQSCGPDVSRALQPLLITDRGSCNSIYQEYKDFVMGATPTSGDGAATLTEITAPTSSTGTASLSGDINTSPSSTATTTNADDARVSSTRSAAGAPKETGYVAVAAAAVIAVAGAMVAL